MTGSDRCIIISADSHCGADIPDYRPYLESKYHDEFDAWAASFNDAWRALDEPDLARSQEDEESKRLGPSSYLDPLNWDSARRQEYVEQEGIVAEILFPNTAPPFYPSAVITAPGPRSQVEYERRLAGIRAHNRWLAEFCQDLPGRRAGIAQVFINDVDDAVREVHWARENGLMGVLLPGDHLAGLVNLYYPSLDPFWAACEELDMPVHRHGILVAETAAEQGVGAPAIAAFEAGHYVSRGLSHLIVSGVFERYPRLKYVIAEFEAAWSIEYMARLQGYCAESEKPGTMGSLFVRPAVEQMSLTPVEYARRNVYFGSFFTPEDVAARSTLGADRLMWASDFPHHEGSYPYSREALRLLFSDVSEEDLRQMTHLSAVECYGFDVDLLQGVADQVGPTFDEIATPIAESELPKVPEDSMCLTFGGIRAPALSEVK